MNTEREYPNRVSDNDEYLTETGKSKKIFLPSLRFFAKLVWIIFYSNRDVKKGVYDSFHWQNSSFHILKSLETSGIRMHFTGMNNFRNVNGPVVFVANHMSTMETMILPAMIRPVKKVLYVIKAELARYPLFGPVATAREPIMVGRENPREDLRIVLEEGSKRLQEGKSIIIFPQKTRSAFFDPASFNSLGTKLAKRNNVPVIPVALLTDAWGNGKYIKEAGKLDPSKTVRFSFGEPLYITGNGSGEHQKIIDFISNKLKEWGRADLAI
jgi:1-acyl-sn-glycerol-3-phosphate acyltransferase